MNRLLVDFVDTIDTPRLQLRVPREGDGPAVFASVQASIDELIRWMPWASKEYSSDDAESWCRKARADFHAREQLQFTILERATQKHVGNIGAFKLNFDVPKCEIGYWLRTDRTGRGYMTEALRSLAEYLLVVHAFRRIEVRCDDENTRSSKVAERAGFTLEGTQKCESRDHHAKLRDTRVYARVQRGT
jgi:RimJ/RimL family protein N-acetyltransferase